MQTSRSYDDACGLARALDVVGERWALLVVRELLFGPKRFTDLRADLPGVSTNILSARLAELERAGVVTRSRLAPPAASWVYRLTAWGRELESVIRSMGSWGARSALEPNHLHLSPTSAVMSMGTFFDPAAARGVTAQFELRLAGDTFHAEVRGGEFSITRGPADDPAAVIETTPRTWTAFLYEGLDLAEAKRSGAITVTGDSRAVQRLPKLFRAPELVE